MSHKVLRNILIFGTIFFFAVMIALTANSLSQVSKTRTAELTDQVVAGKKVWQARNCDDCHTIYGIGGYWAPELTKEADRRDAAFLTNWMTNPQAVKPGTTMPNQRLSSTQVQDMVAFLKWVSETNTNGWPPAPLVNGSGTGSPALLLMDQKGCFVCHMINGQGVSGPGPNLSHIGSTPYDSLSNSADFLSKWILNPVAQKPTTSMPAIAMTDAERATIVQYLVGLQ